MVPNLALLYEPPFGVEGDNGWWIGKRGGGGGDWGRVVVDFAFQAIQSFLVSVGTRNETFQFFLSFEILKKQKEVKKIDLNRFKIDSDRVHFRSDLRSF